MYIEYQKEDDSWVQVETEKVSVFSTTGIGLLGVLKEGKKKYRVAMRGEPLFDQVLQATSQTQGIEKESSTIEVK